MNRLGVLAIVVSMCAIPVSAAVVDGHVYADFVSFEGAYTLYGGATSLADALALPHDGKYAEIKGPAGSSWFVLRMQFPVSALSPTFRVHLAHGTTSRYFTVQGFGDSFSDYGYYVEGVTWTSPGDGEYDVGMYYPDATNYVEVRQRQQWSAGVVYVDAIEATNIPPVVSAGPDLTILTDEQATTVIQGTIGDSSGYSTGYVWQKNGVSLTGWLPFPADGSAPLNLSTLAPLAVGTYTFKLVTKDGGLNYTDEMILTVTSNNPPVPEAGPDVSIYTVERASTVIHGSASDLDNEAMTYRWLEGTAELSASAPVEPNGAAILRLSSLASPPAIGAHALTLEVTDAKGSVRTDATILTVLNTPPKGQPSPTSQVVEAGDPVIISGEAWDFDGDILSYQWIKGAEVLASGSIDASDDGTPVAVPDLMVLADQRFDLGENTVQLVVDDAQNAPNVTDVTVVVNDTTAPTIAPNPSTTMLWPPNHSLCPVTILANAADKGGGDVFLAVAVLCNEPPAPGEQDWYVDSVDNETGTIALRLRAERLGGGTGRVYTITMTATDEGGNHSAATVQVRVPHDKRKK